VRRLAALAALLTIGCQTLPPAPTFTGDAGCVIGEEDRAWLSGAPDAWTLVESEIFGLDKAPHAPFYIFFDAACTYESGDGRTWVAAQHGGAIKTPDGETGEPGVTSSVTPNGDKPYMLMSLPSIWREAGVPDRGDMRVFLYSVFVHEMAHARQFGELYDRIGDAITRHQLGDDFTDDIVQKRFGENAAFKASVERERDILLAGLASDAATTRAAAAEALSLMRARRAQYFIGEHAALLELEDLFLTLEGVGQLAGREWLAHPDGGGRNPEDALAAMRTRWWSQEQGLAIMLIVQRLVPDWSERAFSEHPQTALQLLALAAGET
jgi:hypothetical protein